MKYLYTMFVWFKTFVFNFWGWFSWEKFVYLLLSLFAINLFVYTTILLYGNLFLPHTYNGCYTDVKQDKLNVYRDTDWELDETLMTCMVSDFNCADRVLQSKMCK